MLRAKNVTRPDYLVRDEACNFFLDAKNLTPTCNSGAVLKFALGKNEHQRLKNAECYFKLPIVLMIWDRSDIAFFYCLSDLSAFNISTDFNKRDCLEASFNKSEFYRLSF